MDYKKDYQRYLASPEWKELRAKARGRSGNKCEFCGGQPDHVHHVKYPKRYKDDHLDNLVVACETCHAKLHGIRDDIYVDNWVGDACSIRSENSRIVVKMSFSPFPEEYRQPLTISSQAKRFGNEWAQNLIGQFGGELFVLGKSYEKDVFLDNNIFYGCYKDYSFNDFIDSMLEERESLESQEEIAEAFMQSFSVGPVLCPCKLVADT